MELTLKCKLQKKVSKNGTEYFVLYVEDLDKYFFLNNTEARLLMLLYSSNIETINE